MATKIDLLPRYVPLRRRLKRWSMVAGVLLAATFAFLFAVNLRQQQKLEVLQGDLTTISTLADATTALQDKTTTITGATAASHDAVVFFLQAAKTGAQRAALLDQIRRYILNRVRVDKLDLSDGQNVTMTVNILSPNDYVETLRVMRYAELDGLFVVGSTKASGIPTFDDVPPNAIGGVTTGTTPQTGQAQPVSTGPEPVTFPITVTIAAKLVTPVTVPSPPGTAAAGGAAPTGGAPVTAP